MIDYKPHKVTVHKSNEPKNANKAEAPKKTEPSEEKTIMDFAGYVIGTLPMILQATIDKIETMKKKLFFWRMMAVLSWVMSYLAYCIVDHFCK